MADTKKEKGLVLMYDYRQHLALLDDADRGRLLMALLDYGENGTEPELEGAALMAFSFIRLQMDRNAEKYAEICRKRSEAGKKGGRTPKADKDPENADGDESNGNQSEAKKANAFSDKQTEAKKANTNTKPKPNTKPNTNTKVSATADTTGTASPSAPAAHAGAASEAVPYEAIAELYHTICRSYPKLRGVSANRKKAIAARWKEYGQDIDVFRELFTRAEASAFLKGHNPRNWSADFNWLLNAENMAKVLEGKYSEKDKQTVAAASGFNTDEFFEAALRRGEAYKPAAPTAGEDESIRERAEALKRQIAGG